MGMPEAPVYDLEEFRARTSVPDPSGINTAFDGSDAALNADWSQPVDQLIRIRFTIDQENAIADVTDDLATEFILQYNNSGGGWNTVGAVGADVEDVQYIAAIGFADHDNTTQVIGAGTFVTGDGLETNVATDTVTFSTGAISETELEVSIEIVGANVTDADTIDLRWLWSTGGAAPPATTMTATETPTMTVDKPSVAGTVSSFQYPVRGIY